METTFGRHLDRAQRSIPEHNQPAQTTPAPKSQIMFTHSFIYSLNNAIEKKKCSNNIYSIAGQQSKGTDSCPEITEPQHKNYTTNTSDSCIRFLKYFLFIHSFYFTEHKLHKNNEK